MGTLNNLPELTTPAADDLMLVREVSEVLSKDKRMTLGKIGVLSLPATWSAAQAFNTSVGVGTSDIEAWGSAYRAIQMGGQAAIMFGTAAQGLYVLENAYHDGTNWRRRAAGTASLYAQVAGVHEFFQAVNLGADVVIAWVSVLRIATAGTITLGANTLTVNASGTAALKGVSVGARVYNSVAQSIPNITSTPLTFNSERYDTDLLHSTGSLTSRLVSPVAGKYIVTGSVAFDAHSTGTRHVGIKVGGSTYIAYHAQAATPAPASTRMSISTMYHLALGDYVELEVYQDSGGALNVLALGNYSPEFSMALLDNA